MNSDESTVSLIVKLELKFIRRSIDYTSGQTREVCSKL